LKGASGESKGSRRYDKENLLWQFTVAIRSDPAGFLTVSYRPYHKGLSLVFPDFIEARKKLMAAKVREAFERL